MRLQESDSRKVASVLHFSKMGFGTLPDNFIALRIMTIKKSKFLLSLGVDYPMRDLLLCLTGCNTIEGCLGSQRQGKGHDEDKNN